MHRYSRGIAQAVLGNTPEAEKELLLFRESGTHVPSDRVLHNNSCASLMAVGDAMLEGEIQYRKGLRDISLSSCLFMSFTVR